ncbi:branched-chain amino acid ABC transporter permease [Mangrovitalea sediminis]|uniref:branched-chain amino acid ABC transporter permease n=1 Tax=Mangrovitalea sediminis TaxID=1982043 RepID=UPI000BE5F19D|nr:branched-chain amino acid ABC transporter permease [Mangrovitalea sediminis]
MNKTFWIILFVLGLLAPFAVYPVLMMELLCFALFACAFNLLLGYSGLLSFGHAAFFGSAAYITGFVMTQWNFGPFSGIVAGTLFAGALGLVFGLLAIRRQGIYFAMITLALEQIVFFLSLKLPFTGGEDGLQGIPRGMLFGFIDLNQPLNMYYTVFAIFVACFWLIHRTVHSPFGQVLRAIRENEPRAISLGYNVERIKLLAFVLSATLAGTAGATKSIVFQTASLTDVSWHTSGSVILMTLLGGMGTLLGPIVGAFTVVGLEHELSGIGSWVTVIIGMIFIVCVLAFRRGIVGEIGRLWKRSF